MGVLRSTAECSTVRATKLVDGNVNTTNTHFSSPLKFVNRFYGDSIYIKMLIYIFISITYVIISIRGAFKSSIFINRNLETK